MIEAMLWLIIACLLWFVIGWVFVVVSDLIAENKLMYYVESVINKAEDISPWLVLFVVFGPIGWILKKNLYDRPPEL